MTGRQPARRWHPTGPRYRTIDRARVLNLLLLSGWAFEVRAGATDHCLGEAAEVLDRLVRLGLPCRAAPDGAPLFDPVEVVNFVKWTGLTGRDPFWSDRYVVTGRRLVREGGQVAPGGTPSGEAGAPRRFTALLRRRFGLSGLRSGAPLRLRLPLPIEDDALRDLRVEPGEPGPSGLDLSVTPTRVEARGATPDAEEVSLSVRCMFTTRPVLPRGPAPPLEPVERARYLHPVEGLIQVTGRVRSLADHLAGNDRDSWRVVHRFRRFMLDRLACGAVHYDAVRAAPAATDWVLETGWFDCQLGAALLAALCRARGIPARLAGGYLLYGTAPTQHHWAEIWLEDRGWAPFDLLAWDLSLAGRDGEWSDHFAGWLDHRMTTQRLPLVFTGPMSVRLPAAWHVLTRASARGTVTTFLALSPETLVYEDCLAVDAG